MAADPMARPDPLVRAATPADAPDLARFAEMASDGLVLGFWAGLAEPGEDLLAVGARRAARGEGAFSWRNASVAELDGRVAGGLLAYPLPEVAEPTDGLPEMARPLVALENLVPGSFYVNILATHPRFRGRGVATTLLRAAERLAGERPMSLIVAGGNDGAQRLYHRLGFVERARRPIAGAGGVVAAGDWVLMLRPQA